MPEIFRAFGYSFLFFSRDYEPIPIHVIGKGGDAKYVWNGVEFTLQEIHGIKLSDQKKIKAMIDENSDIIINAWNLYFG